jgi:glycosyltransferase involved in cell wall biosynthesis
MMDIGIVIPVHNEGLLAEASVACALHAAGAARIKGLQVSLTIVADRVDTATTALLEGWRARGANILDSAAGDLGLARNAAIDATPARFIALLDGDDLWGDGWLAAAHEAAHSDPRRVVWHPEGNLYFGQGGDPRWLLHPDMEHPDFDASQLWLRNLWNSLCFAPRELFLEVPYRPTRLADGFGYEDWNWHLNTIGRGILHKVVPGTVHLLRQKPVSLVRLTAAAGALVIQPERDVVI